MSSSSSSSSSSTTLGSLRKFLGLAPQEDGEGGFSPSPVMLKLAVPSKTDYKPIEYENKYEGNQEDGGEEEKKKVLVVCTEEKYMTMANGLKFSTGNHPVEMFVPLLHLEAAGFEIDICTPTGKPVVLERWAIPSNDEAVLGILEKYTANKKLDEPLSLAALVADNKTVSENSPYIAVFIPGGHGAMLGLPENENLRTLLEWVSADTNSRYLLTICHGPAALLAAAPKSTSTTTAPPAAGDNAAATNEENTAETKEDSTADKSSVPFAGYEMAVFPDRMDKMTPSMGYMPGHMPWYFGERLTAALGCKFVSSTVMATGAVHRDRNLVTGDSPMAAQAFGKLAAETLLAAVNPKPAAATTLTSTP